MHPMFVRSKIHEVTLEREKPREYLLSTHHPSPKQHIKQGKTDACKAYFSAHV